MPKEYAKGKYGYKVYGLIGMHVLPEPKPHTHRISMRYGEIPTYIHEVGNYQRFKVPITQFPKKYALENKPKDANEIWTEKLHAMARCYPLYLKYLSFSILKGKNKQLVQLDPVLDGWIKNYIEPSDGNSNGYKFYLSEGYGDINLDAILDKKKVTDHKLSKLLKEINDELTKDSKKIEYDYSTDLIKNKKFFKDNITDQDVAKFIGLCCRIKKVVNEIVFEKSTFPDVKYKVANTSKEWEGYLPPVGAKDLILILPQEDITNFQLHRVFATPGNESFSPSSDWFGIEVIPCAALDKGTAYLLNRNLIQLWFMPVLARTYTQPYLTEETIDYVAEFGHSVDLVKIHCNIYFTTKS